MKELNNDFIIFFDRNQTSGKLIDRVKNTFYIYFMIMNKRLFSVINEYLYQHLTRIRLFLRWHSCKVHHIHSYIGYEGIHDLDHAPCLFKCIEMQNNQYKHDYQVSLFTTVNLLYKYSLRLRFDDMSILPQINQTLEDKTDSIRQWGKPCVAVTKNTYK